MTFLCQHRDLNLLLRIVVMSAFHSPPSLLLLTLPPFHMKYLTTEDSTDSEVNVPTPHLVMLIPRAAHPARHPRQAPCWYDWFPNHPPSERCTFQTYPRLTKEKEHPLPCALEGRTCWYGQFLFQKPMTMLFSCLNRASWGLIQLLVSEGPGCKWGSIIVAKALPMK